MLLQLVGRYKDKVHVQRLTKL